MKSEFEQNADYRDDDIIKLITQLYCKFSNTRELLKNNHRQHNLLLILCDILKKNHIHLELERKANSTYSEHISTIITENYDKMRIGFGVYQPASDTTYYDCNANLKDKPKITSTSERRIR